MKHDIKNMEQSVRDRLKRLQQETGRPFNFYLRLYMQEGLLNRLSRSAYQEYFILKGGLFLFSRIGLKARPTQDMDFLGRNIANDEERIEKAFREIAQISCDDGLRFDASTLTIETITEAAEYGGHRVRMMCYLGTIRDRIQVDIGFGDIVVPRPKKATFPTLLDIVEAPEIFCYSEDSVVAEKLQAAVDKGLANSRMKDFFDIYTLAKHHSFDGRVLQEAISETFSRRGTSIQKELLIFNKEFGTNPLILNQWKPFLLRLGLNEPSFVEVLDTIERFIAPVWNKLCNEDEFFGRWNPSETRWEFNRKD